jgi:hypothetical protein
MKKMSKAKFLTTNIGMAMVENLRRWSEATDRLKRKDSTLTQIQTAMHMQDTAYQQHKVYALITKELYGVDYEFVYEADYFGAATKDRKDWLFKEIKYPKWKERMLNNFMRETNFP